MIEIAMGLDIISPTCLAQRTSCLLIRDTQVETVDL
jgi:hypothetical protein